MKIKTTAGEDAEVEDQRGFRWTAYVFVRSGDFLVAVRNGKRQSDQSGDITVFQLDATGVYRLARTINLVPDPKIGHCFKTLCLAPPHEQTASVTNGDGNGHVKPGERGST